MSFDSANLEEDVRVATVEVVDKSVSKKGKKRELDPENWKKNVLKKQRHVSKGVPPMIKCNHEKKSIFECNSLNLDDITKFHTRFYASCDKVKQDCFLLKYICNHIPVRPRTNSNKDVDDSIQRKACVNKYFVPRFRHDTRNHDIQVCQTKFLNILGISKNRIQRITRTHLLTGENPKENRGGDRRKDKYSDRRQSVKAFIEALNPEPNYCQEKGCNRRYLPSDLTTSKLWKTYNENATPELVVKYEYFRSIFVKEYNISFKTPFMYVCSVCLQKNKAKNPQEYKKPKELPKKTYNKVSKPKQPKQLIYPPPVPMQSPTVPMQSIYEGSSKDKPTNDNTSIYSWAESGNYRGVYNQFLPQ